MPEKSLTEVPTAVRDLYDKGLAAVRKNNFDYAVALFGQALKLEPAFWECRQALRATQHKRSGNRSTGLFKRFLGSASTLTKGRLALRNDPAAAIQIAEEALNDDPSNAEAHQLLADAAAALDLPQTAALSLDIAFKNNPGDRRLAVRLSEALVVSGQRARAEKLLRDLLASDPTDPDLNERLKNLLAHRTLQEGYKDLAGGTGSYRDALRDRDQAVTLEQESRTVKDVDVTDRLIREYEARAAAEPDNQKLLRDLADLHRRKGDAAGAIRWYEQLLRVGGVSDPAIHKAIHETRLEQFDREIAVVDPADPDAETRRAELRKAREDYLLDNARRQAEANPTDLQLRYDLGRQYFEAGRISEAIGELQRAQNNPHRRIGAMLLLARCFAHRGMNDLAARKLEEALKEKQVFDDEKKELHYQLGSVLERAGKPAEAIEQFKLIYEMDIGYRDVGAKVDAYYAGGG